MEQGLIHVYHGNGKGKTTAAIGLAIRAAGTGKKVFFTQFMKGGKTGELKILNNLDGITVIRSEKDFPFYSKMNEEQKEELTSIHNQILKEIKEAILEQKPDLIIMDEITYPCSYKLLDESLLKEIITLAKGHTELVMTGRNPQDFLLEGADYITEMKCIRHPYEKGIVAREGIEF